jgi:hypothetical protein
MNFLQRKDEKKRVARHLMKEGVKEQERRTAVARLLPVGGVFSCAIILI